MKVILVTAMVAAGAVYGLSSGGGSSIVCRVEGGNLPARATTIAFVHSGGRYDLTVTREYWDQRRRSAAVTVSVTAEEYRRLWVLSLSTL